MNQDHYTAEQVVELLASKQGDRNQRQFAAEIGITQQYLCDVLRRRRGVGLAILNYLGLEQTYIKSQRAA